MKTSQYFLPLILQPPTQVKSPIHALMLRAGMIRQLNPEQYAWLPFGFKALKQLKRLLQKKMETLGALEAELPILEGNLPPEVAMTRLIQPELRSYKQLPLHLYQIQPETDEKGLIQPKTSLIKTLFTFHSTLESLEKMTQAVFETYHQLFSSLGLSGSFHGEPTHRQYTINGLEIANLSSSGYDHTKPLKVHVLDERGKGVVVAMGCYSINIDRLFFAILEHNQDERGIRWPPALSPFQIAILPINYHKSYRVRMTAENIYHTLQQAGFEVLFEDQKERLGSQFAKMDFLGIPVQLIINERDLDENQIGCQYRQKSDTIMLSMDQIAIHLKKEFTRLEL